VVNFFPLFLGEGILAILLPPAPVLVLVMGRLTPPGLVGKALSVAGEKPDLGFKCERTDDFGVWIFILSPCLIAAITFFV
jgi:hypothetical protein